MATRAARIAATHIRPQRPVSARQVSRASQVSRAETARSLEMQAGVAWLINWCAQVELDLRRQRLGERLAAASLASATALSMTASASVASVGASYGA